MYTEEYSSSIPYKSRKNWTIYSTVKHFTVLNYVFMDVCMKSIVAKKIVLFYGYLLLWWMEYRTPYRTRIIISIYVKKKLRAAGAASVCVYSPHHENIRKYKIVRV